MVKQYAFYVDSSSCSGCKACQVACKDKHTLETGILWRRVYEITGGDWLQVGKAWTPHVFAYNLSIACNHCEKPVCLEVCPAGAYSKRNDGIVLLDTDRCLGCHYCEWACPYGAPQYDTKSGQMTKCNFCFELIDAGQPPACVSACPMRALDYGDRTELEARYGRASAIFPLPPVELTQPALVITPHPDAREAREDAGRIANREEVHPV